MFEVLHDTSNFCNWQPFFADVYCGKLTLLSQSSQLNLTGKERRVGKGVAGTWGAITGDGERPGE